MIDHAWAPGWTGRVFLILSLLVALPGTKARAVDGFAITVHYDCSPDTWGNIHEGRPDAPTGKFVGKLIRYDIKDGKTIDTKVLYDKADVGDVRLSPFGDRVAFVRSDGMIMVESVDGGEATEVGPVTNPGVTGPVDTMIYWPSSDGGRWIYYHDQRVKNQNVLRRVSLDTHKDEFVVQFNNVGGGDMTPDASPDTGHIVIRTDNYHVRVYSFESGDGDLQHCPDYIPGCGISCSPDNQLFTANSGWHDQVNLVDMNAQIRTGWRISEFDGDPTKDIDDRSKVGYAWQNFRWAANAMNLISVQQGPLKPGTSHLVNPMDVVLYDWTNRHQYNLTNNPMGGMDRACGFWAAGQKEGYLGSFQGKAPLTVVIADKRLNDGARWDFGDGSSTAGASAMHIYAKEGHYNLVVHQADDTYRAMVNVLRRENPRAEVIYVNKRCLLIRFDERVNADKARLELASGDKVDHFQLNDTGTQMMVYLADDMKASDRLAIHGVQDLAQAPNFVDGKPVAIKRPAWPDSRLGLTWVWEDASALNAVYDPTTGHIRMCSPIRDRDVAGIGRYGRMYCGLMGLDGSLVTGFYTPNDTQDIIKAGQFSMECVFQPASLHQFPHKLKSGQDSPYPCRIMQSGSWYDDNWMFLIGQKDDRLEISVRTSDNMTDDLGHKVANGLSGISPLYDIAALKDLRPHHLVVTYKPGLLVAYLDGKKVFENTDSKGSLSNWNYGELTFGDCHNGGRHGWLGNIEGVALYARALESDEVARNYRYFIHKFASRIYPPRIQVEATVTAVTKVPDAKRILPYTEALVTNEYQVVKVLDKDPKWSFEQKIIPGARIRVAQWGLVPARFQAKKTWVADLKLGDKRTLTLEVYKNNIDNLDSVTSSDDLDISDQPLLYEPRE